MITRAFLSVDVTAFFSLNMTAFLSLDVTAFLSIDVASFLSMVMTAFLSLDVTVSINVTAFLSLDWHSSSLWMWQPSSLWMWQPSSLWIYIGWTCSWCSPTLYDCWTSLKLLVQFLTWFRQIQSLHESQLRVNFLVLNFLWNRVTLLGQESLLYSIVWD